MGGTTGSAWVNGRERFSSLWEKESPSLHGFLGHIVSPSLRCSMELDDIAQEVALRAFSLFDEKFHRKNREDQEFHPWLCRLTTHRVLSIARAEERRCRRVVFSSAALESPDRRNLDPDEILWRSERDEIIRRVAYELERPKDRIILAIYFRGLAKHDLAALYSISSSGVEKRHARGLTRFRERLLETYGPEAFLW